MIIVNQNKDKLINSNMINSIEIENFGEHLGINERAIKAYFGTDYVILGKYENKKRAEAILEEMIENLCDYKIYYMPNL